MTAQKAGYALVDTGSGAIIKTYPNDDRQVEVPDIDGNDFTWQEKTYEFGLRKIVELWRDDVIPPDTKKTGETQAFDGTRVNVTMESVPLTAQEIAARQKALALRDLGDTDGRLIRAIEDLVERTDKMFDAMKNSVAVDETNIPDVPQTVRDLIAQRKALRAQVK